jgi:hypothetical protein
MTESGNAGSRCQPENAGHFERGIRCPAPHSRNHRHGGADPQPLCDFDGGLGLHGIQVFVDDSLHAPRTALHAEEDAVATGSRHQFEKFLVRRRRKQLKVPIVVFAHLPRRS